MDSRKSLHPALVLGAAAILVAALASLLFKWVQQGGFSPRFSLLAAPPAAAAAERGPEERLLPEAHRCPFGRWYHSPARQEMERRYPELQPFLAELGALHLEMHRSARVIRAFMTRGDRQAALAYHEENAAPALQRLVFILREMEAQGPRLCRREPDLAACTQKFAVLFANFGGVLCGCYSFGDSCRTLVQTGPEPPAISTAASLINRR